MLPFIKANPLLVGAFVLLIGFGLWLLVSMTERGEIREETNLRESGAVTERLETNEEVLNRVEQAKDAVRDPDPGELERVRGKYDRCRRADC